MSPVGLWIWFKFLNVFMKCIYTGLALLNEDLKPKSWHKDVRGEEENNRSSFLLRFSVCLSRLCRIHHVTNTFI